MSVINLNIETKNNDINYIVHISDIHIRLLDRHDEYKQVFNNVYDYIKTTPEDTLVFLGGDIVHSKLSMSAEMIDIVSEFFTNLSNLRPVILIKGNHDLNVKNMKRMDVLYPIVKSLNLNNFYYIDDYSNVYNYKDKINFVLYPFWSDELPPVELLSPSTINIGMYHGALNGSKTDTGMILSTDIETSKFKDVDILLLGDIHKYQVLSDVKPITLYPGSLIQQDFGEHQDKHGLVFWNLNDKTYKHIDIDNDYGYYNVELSGDDLDEIELNKIKSKKPSVKVRFNKKDKIYFDSVKKKLKKQFPNIQKITPDRVSEFSSLTNEATQVLVNFNDEKTQIELLREYYTTNNIDFTDVIELHNKILSDVDINKKVNNVWKPINLKFSNLFSYGEYNEIDFRDMNGSYGIFAPNTSGKSSIMEIISFVCFNKTSKTNQVLKMLNVNKDKFSVDFVFEHNNTLYKIERTGVKHKTKAGTKVKLDTNFYMVDDQFNVLEDLTKSKIDIYKDLKSYLGEYDDFVLTALSLQNNNTNFIDKTQSERKELIQQFLEMDIFEKLHTISNKKANELKVILNVLNIKFNSLIGEDFEKEVFETELKYNDIIHNLNNNKIILDEYNNSILELTSQLINVNDLGDTNVDDIRSIIDNNNIMINKINFDIDIDSKELDRLKLEFNGELNEDEYRLVLDEYNKLDREIGIINASISNIEAQLNKYNNLSFSDNCDDCNNNIKVLRIDDDKLKLNNLVDNKRDADELINSLINKTGFNSIDEYKNDFNRRSKTQSDIFNCDIRLTRYKLNKQQLDDTNKSLNDKIILIEKSKESILHNEKLKVEINDIKLKIHIIKQNINSDERDANELKTAIDLLKFKISERDKLKIDVISTNKEYNNYVNYSSAVSKNGIPLTLIKNVIDVLNDEVNLILENITTFKILFELIDNDINASITYDDEKYWDVSTVSGMEKFITSLSIRIALINISQLPRPNFICIDEGFGVLDANNLNELNRLFDYLKTIFNFYIIITHIEVLRDFIDNNIDIQKVNGYSTINYL